MRYCFTATIAAALVATSAQAAVTGVVWRVVDNTVGAPGSDAFAGAQWNALSQYTVDLILQGDAGQRINGINMGDSNFPNAAPFALYTNGTVFNHSFGSNVQSATEFPPFNAMAYDTYVDLGGTQATPAISFAGGTDLSGAGGVLRATWFTTDNAVLDANGEMRIMRITVGYAPGFDPFTQQAYLGTLQGVSPVSSLEVGLPGGELATLVIGNAFSLTPPTPGTAALLGIAGVSGLRRRRN